MSREDMIIESQGDIKALEESCEELRKDIMRREQNNRMDRIKLKALENALEVEKEMIASIEVEE